MKRRLGTALSVLGLLAVGTAAAAVNVRMLHDAGSESAQFQMHSIGDVAPLVDVGNDRSTVMPGTDWPDASDSATTSGMPMGPGGPGPLGAGDGRGGMGEGPHGFGAGDRPLPTPEQMMLLRVSAMVRMDPATVRALARGTHTDATLLAAVKEAAQAIGTTLTQLAAVEALPPMHGRGHGGPGGGRHERFGVDTHTMTYDD
jgi:hypothetical protein